ncbi:MAG: ankyrin repeat domain-containing protein [Gammaproteobacteria bacterium]|nr:ankyrin repeat domain-containing protein [Gammaproteobacteria bacterium]
MTFSYGEESFPLRLYSHDIGFHTPYLAGLAREAADGFAEAQERFVRIARFADLDPEAATLIDALEVSAVEHGFSDWRAMELRLREIQLGSYRERSIGFFEAVEQGDLDTVVWHLDAEPELVNAVASTQKSALHSVGSPEMANLLLDRGADPRIETMLLGGTALVHAIIWGWPEIAQIIAARDRAPDNLRVAAGLNDLSAIEASFDTSGKLKGSAKQARRYYRPNYGWFPWETGDEDQEVLDEALILAATNGHIEAADALVTKGARIDGRAYETTPLLRATFRNRTDMVDWLLDRGADPNGTGWLGGHAKGVTAFHLAASDGLRKIIDRLRQAGADPSITDDLYNSTPAGWARFHGHPELAGELQKLV